MARDVALQADGKIVLGGWAYNWFQPHNDLALVRLNTDASLDGSFDGDGKLIMQMQIGVLATDIHFAVSIEAGTGKIVAAGQSGADSSANFAIARYNLDGSPDLTFDGDGKLTTSFGTSTKDICYGMTIDSSGRYVLVGESAGDFAIAR